MIFDLTKRSGGGTYIQPPYKVLSGSVVPSSDTQALGISTAGSGMTAVCVASIVADDYENYATKYADEKPLYLRSNYANVAPFNMGDKASRTVSLQADGTLYSSTNSNYYGFANDTFTFGCWIANGRYKAGVTYHYVIVGL